MSHQPIETPSTSSFFSVKSLIKLAANAIIIGTNQYAEIANII
tara:strand:+ start:503 stop:631 length:129 start_codon:yes stop_codon:yes gene_type:complete